MLVLANSGQRIRVRCGRFDEGGGEGMGWWPMFWKAWVRNVFWLHAPFIEKSVLDGQHLSSSSFLLQHSLTVFFWIHQDYHRGLSHGKSLLTSPRCFLATGGINEGRGGWEMVGVDGGSLTVEHVLSWLWCNVWTIECYRSKQPMHDTLVVCGACELNCWCCMTECVQGYATRVELSGSGNGKLSAPSKNFLNDQTKLYRPLSLDNSVVETTTAWTAEPAGLWPSSTTRI